MILTGSRKLIRDTMARDRKRPIVVEVESFYLRVRVKGTHETHLVPYDAILDLGRKLDARLERE